MAQINESLDRLKGEEFTATFGLDPKTSCKQIDEAITRIDEIIEDLKSEYSPDDEDSFWKGSGDQLSKGSNTRSIFDDVDV